MKGLMQVKERPQSGPFLIMWIHDGDPWAEPCKYLDGMLYHYNSTNHFWEQYDHVHMDNETYWVVESEYKKTTVGAW